MLLLLVQDTREDKPPTCQMGTRRLHAQRFDEYIETWGAEIGSYTAISCSDMGLGEIGKKRYFEWLRSRPKVVQVLAAKTRLMDDMTDYEVSVLLK